MRTYKLEYSPRAKRDIEEIYQYITLKFANPMDAERTLEKIEARCFGLEIAPRANPVAIDVGGVGFRFARVKRYTIIYSVNDTLQAVRIHAIVYSRIDLQSLIANLVGA